MRLGGKGFYPMGAISPALKNLLEIFHKQLLKTEKDERVNESLNLQVMGRDEEGWVEAPGVLICSVGFHFLCREVWTVNCHLRVV